MLINSGNNFNLREVCRGKGAILIQKESREGEKGAFPCHATLAIIVGGSNGKMVTALLTFFIWLCLCKPRGNSLYAIEKVFDNSEDQTEEEGRAY